MSPTGPRGRRDLFAAAWWSASLRPLQPVAWAGAAGLVFGGCAELIAEMPQDEGHAALEQQQAGGWNVGGEGLALAFPGAQPADISGGAGWSGALLSLAGRLGPTSARWAPYYNPTLFQSLEAPRNADLRAVMRPIFTPEMALASRRGEVLASLLNADGVCRNDVAVVLDLAGPEAVAVAAALAPCLDPVFVLDNWPHPAGVVPAHLTLAAALYFLPAFERAAPARSPAAAPVFVLDRQRLAPYVDDAGQFDNRYLASLPPREALQAAGIRQVLYVTPDDRVTMEADDLNDDLVAFDREGLDVKMLALADFSERPLPDWPDIAPCGGAAVALGPGQLYFGGSPGAQSCFTFWYGWQPPSGSLALNLSPAPRPPIPVRLAPRCRFHPAPRASVSLGGHPSMGGGWRGGGWHGGGWHFAGRSGSMGRVHFGGMG
jgi:hypothetical protein